MKSLLALLLVASSFGLSAQALTKNTKHDLSSTGPGAKGNTTQVCVFCHTPHNSAVGAALQLIPLWNKAPGSAGAFTMYATGGTIQGVIDAAPTGASLACFSCHDGTQSVGAVIDMPYGVAGTAITFAVATPTISTAGLMTGTNMLGKDLSNDHPVSITYPTTDPGMVAKATVLALANSVKLFGTLGSEKVQCASCHDVHNATIVPFLRVSTVSSALCTTCHIK